MKKPILLVSFLIIAISSLVAQSTEIKKVNYANIQIDVPTNYTAKDEYSIENNSFSAQWIYLTNKMVEQGVEKQILNQIEKQLKYSKATNISFTSNGEQFSGKKYQLKGEMELIFRIIAFGSINGQPLVLNLAFKKDPKSDEETDELMKKFITFKRL
ncbi:hypothetical protein [Sphingobacterium sp. MYb388]|uniref:hypothetical protein n=1 Tax=Sphingobacterium sp. MYb388 TaxID=2745437 RepID=UPI00309F8BC7